jgi:probable F420-dependent oxidoreductase
MRIGIFYGTTDYAALPHDVAAACEERGFESFWVPEHTHIPASRNTPYPGGGELPEHYYHLHDPFVSLASAAVVTRRIKLGTAVCLVSEHDPIVLAKQVASLDLLSNGRVIFGIGAGWNREEMLNHGTDPSRRWKVVREEFVNFERIWCWPKPVQRPHPPILLGSATERGRQRVVRYCDGWLPFATPKLAAEIGDLHRRARDANRDPGSISVSLLSPRPHEDDLRRYRDMGVERAILLALPAALDELLPRFDRYAKLIRALEA